jgi:two-component system, chemotaxis family, chemotaxis protein CheY
MTVAEKIRRVVLADDMDDLPFLLALSLERAGGFEIVGHATNGIEAIKLAESEKPDVVVLDLAMPVMDGMEAIPKIREVSPETRIVMLTGFDSGRLAEQAMSLGAHAYLEKSLALIDISTTLIEVCD